MKQLFVVCLVIYAIACGSKKEKSIELITRVSLQDSLFRRLAAITDNFLSDSLRSDSLAFLVLPLEASCPSCRRKTIDSIVKCQNKLAKNHFIILSGKSGRKSMSSYFREQKAELPNIPGQLIIDSTNQAYQHKLFKNNPAIYYAVNHKVYKKVFALPATVKQDLQEFFSGWRNDEY